MATRSILIFSFCISATAKVKPLLKSLDSNLQGATLILIFFKKLDYFLGSTKNETKLKFFLAPCHPLCFKMSVTYDLQTSVPPLWECSVTYYIQMSVPPFFHDVCHIWPSDGCPPSFIYRWQSFSPPQAKPLHGGGRCSRSAHLTQPCCDFL